MHAAKRSVLVATMQIRVFTAGLLALFVIILICGCRPKASDQEVERLKREVDSLRLQLQAVSKIVDKLPIKEALVSTEKPTAGRVQTSFGVLTVFAEGIRPYLDGYMVTLEIGNPLLAEFPDSKVTVGWGAMDTERKERMIPLTKPIKAGTLTLVDVAFTPASAEEVKLLDVSIELDTIILRSK